MPEELSGFRRVRVKGKALTVSVAGSCACVSVTMDTDGSDPQVMSAIGAALDGVLQPRDVTMRCSSSDDASGL